MLTNIVQAGATVADITPQSAVWMDGMIRSHRSVGIHDPVCARALVLASGPRPVDCHVLMSLDLCALSAAYTDRIRAEAACATGIPADQMIIAATHTHSGPAAYGYFNPKEEAYVEQVIARTADLVRQAASSLAPVLIGSASGREATISHYRRLLATDGHVVMNWEPYPRDKIVGPLGEIDPEVGVIKITPAAHPRESLALLFNHAGHPNVMSGDNYLISADYSGLAERLLEKQFGGTAIFFNGAQGTMDIDGLKDRDWPGVDRVAKALAGAVAETAERIEPVEHAAIRGGASRYTIPARRISDAELALADKVASQTGGAIKAAADGVGDDYKAALYKRLRQVQDKDIPLEQVCIIINDCALISFPGELFTEIGMRIKAESPFRHTYILGLANGAIGYVPTRVAIRQGGYEPDMRAVDDSAEEIVVAQSLKLLREVAAKRQ
jgi:neutral ceramidase